jgi:integrase
MPVVKMTPQWLKRLQPTDSIVDYWDSESDVGLRVMPRRADVPDENVVMTWQCRYRKAGLRRRYKLSRYPTIGLAAARKLAKKELAKVDGGADPAATKTEERGAVTLRSLVERYIEDGTKKDGTKRADKTTGDYGRLAKAVLAGRSTVGATLADSVRRADIKVMLRKIAKDSPIYANRALALIRASYRWGADEDLVKADATAGLRMPGPKKSRDRVLTGDEVRKVWHAVDSLGRVVAGAVKVMLLCGTRRSETLTARWSDFDLEGEKIWHIPGTSRKGGENLTVPLAPLAVETLKGLLPPVTGSGFVFSGPKGASINANPARWCAKVREATGVSFRLHDLRRTCASGCGELGAPPYIISMILGHKLPDGVLPVTLVYDRAARLGEIRPVLTSWAGHVSNLLVDEKPAAGSQKRRRRAR